MTSNIMIGTYFWNRPFISIKYKERDETCVLIFFERYQWNKFTWTAGTCYNTVLKPCGYICNNGITTDPSILNNISKIIKNNFVYY